MTATLLIKVAAEVTFMSGLKEIDQLLRKTSGRPTFWRVFGDIWVIQYGINVILQGVDRHVATRRPLLFLHKTFRL
jgi:hypothetical protein